MNTGTGMQLTLCAQSRLNLTLRLFHFRYGYRDSGTGTSPFDQRLDTSTVKVDVRGKPEANDLLSCLSADLFLDGDASNGRQQVIYEPSDVVAFQLVRENMPSSTGAKVERHTFGYPDHIYLDQFLKENAEFAAEKRKLQHELHTSIQKLIDRRESLTKVKVSDLVNYHRCDAQKGEHLSRGAMSCQICVHLFTIMRR